jgi:hypothetical protein
LFDPNWGASLVINASDDGMMSVLAQAPSVSLSASPVPEPGIAVSLLAGLGLVGFAVRRRAA